MTKAVFTTKAESAYDDRPWEYYHFPKQYLGQAENTVGDFIVYYEPRRTSGDLASRGGRQAYFATGRVVAIEQDAKRADHFYALIHDYLEFDRPVPFVEGVHYYEGALRRPDGRTNKGAFGRAVRPIRDQEYDAILRAGFDRVLADLEPHAPPPADTLQPFLGVAEEPQEPFERPLVERVVARPFREVAFARKVKAAYHDTCAFTGLQIINGGGRSEVQAAHIRPVAADGPDSVRNGVALCATFHWMFDRGLLSVSDDHRVLMAKGRVPETVARLILPDGRLKPPEPAHAMPHPRFLAWHRKEVFKGS